MYFTHTKTFLHVKYPDLSKLSPEIIRRTQEVWVRSCTRVKMELFYTSEQRRHSRCQGPENTHFPTSVFFSLDTRTRAKTNRRLASLVCFPLEFSCETEIHYDFDDD